MKRDCRRSHPLCRERDRQEKNQIVAAADKQNNWSPPAAYDGVISHLCVRQTGRQTDGHEVMENNGDEQTKGIPNNKTTNNVVILYIANYTLQSP